MKTAERALLLACVWLSPAALLGLAPALLADGTRGLWAPLALAGGAVLAVLLLAEPGSRGVGPSGRALRDLARRRWPSAERVVAPLVVAEVGSALLFLWAQLAASRELGQALGWSPMAAAAVGTGVLVVAGWRAEVATWLAGLGSALAVSGLVAPLVVALAVTTPWWPRVWAEVASRPALTFSERGAWATEGRAIRGPGGLGSAATIPFEDEQRVTLLERSRVRILPWEGGEIARDAPAGTELTLRPGDRLVVPDGLPLRFQAGRRIPEAPATGPDWVDPPGRRAGWRTLIGLGVTLLLGPLGLPAVHATLPAGRSTESRAARVGAGLVVVGVLTATLWALYAAWLTPEIYTAGVVGVEVYELPGGLTALGASGRWLRILALAGLAGGGVAASLAALRGVPRRLPPALGRLEVPLAAVVVAGALAAIAPARSWSLLIAAFALGASAAAPAAVLTCWAERVTARALAAGAIVGLALFGVLSLAGLWGGVGPDRGTDGAWLGWLLTWPALAAMPLNALAAWLLSSRPAGTSRSQLPPGLADLHDRRDGHG